MPELLVLSQLVLAGVMTGIIWQVQVLTYPQFLKVPVDSFHAYHQSHMKRMGWVVGPPMLAEIGLASWCLWKLGGVEPMVGLLLVVAIWATTGLFQVPMHRRLSEGRDELVIRALVASNWLRTVLWTARLAWLAAWLLRLTD